MRVHCVSLSDSSRLLREEEEAVQAGGRGGGGRGRPGQADAPQEEEEGHLRAEEEALVRGGLHSCWLATGCCSHPLVPTVRLSE